MNSEFHMRASMISLAIALLGSIHAQADDGFNPYQAVKDRMPLGQAMQQINASYAILDWKKNAFAPYDGGPILFVQGEHEGSPIFFVFCNGNLSGASAPIETSLVAEIVNYHQENEKITTTVLPAGIWVHYTEQDIGLEYLGVGTPNSYAKISYPAHFLIEFDDYTDFCSTQSK